MCVCVCLLIARQLLLTHVSSAWPTGAVPGPREQCGSNAVHCCWMNVRGIQGPLWSSPFLLSRYTLCCSPPWSWFPVWMPFFSSNLENPTHSLVFGRLSPSLWSLPWLPASYQNFFLFLWAPKVLCLHLSLLCLVDNTIIHLIGSCASELLEELTPLTWGQV